jgi:hypothetical protein
MKVLLWAAAALWAGTITLVAQRTDVFTESRDHPAIAYSTAPVTNAVTALSQKLARGEARLVFDPDTGYLRSVLDALGLPIESQLLAYAPTSFQAKKISRTNPRAIYFNDGVAVAFVRGGDLLEFAVHDPKQGAIFYAMRNSEAAAPAIARDDQCLACHLSWETKGVPGLFIQTVFPRRNDEEYANGFMVDHRTPFADRWGGWFVTGARVPKSMANQELLQPKMPETGPAATSATPALDQIVGPRGYPLLQSDVVALLVFDHQVQASNLITRAGWEHRIGSPHVREAVNELVDYLLFVDEAPLPHPVKGASGFAEKFAAQGPRDRQGRSLREFDLTTRLMRYPLSYMIYSPGFAGLPPQVKTMVRARLDDILSGRHTGKKYAHLDAATRQAIQQIVAETLTAS